MQSKATTVAQYLAELEPDRKKALQALRKVIRTHLDPRVKETMQYGMIGYAIPHSVYPDGYHCDPSQPLPFLSLASQKRHMALYLFCLYVDGDEVARFEAGWKATGKKLDMGKSCVRFRKLEDVPLEVVGDAIARMDVDRFLESYEASLAGTARKKAPKKKPARKTAKKASKKKAAATKKAGPKRAKAAKKAVKKKASRKKAPTRRT
ncbi:MAG: DUF1801 domain-containing protein [Planctomycetota bacterium]